MNKEEYKLKGTDFNYLDIDFYDYKPEELGILKGYIDGKSEIPTVEELIKELCNQHNYEYFDMGEWLYKKYKLEVYQKIHDIFNHIYGFILGLKGPEDIYLKVFFEGMIKLREKGINSLGTPHPLGEIYPWIEGEEIADYRLYHFNSERAVNIILKKRNIERLKKLFEEENAEKD